MRTITTAECCARRSLAALAGAALLFTAQHAGAEHYWATYHWETSTTPLALALGDNLSGAWVPGSPSYLEEAASDWNRSSVLALSVTTGAPKNLRRCAPHDGKVEICNDTYGNNGWLGIAQISIQGSHIISASVRLNDTYFLHPSYNSYDWRQFVMCQEVGHVFGLGHQDENFTNADLGSCMDYTRIPAANLEPNGHDYALLDAIYAHVHESDTTEPDAGDSGGPSCKGGWKRCGSGAPGASERGDDAGGDSPAQWGRLVSAHGPQETFELDLGQGRKRITHVLWTIESTEAGHAH